MTKMTAVPKLIVEALVVGVMLVIAFAVIHAVSMKVCGDAAMTDHRLLFAQVGVAGGLFHVFYELFGINEWYCKHR